MVMMREVTAVSVLLVLLIVARLYSWIFESLTWAAEKSCLPLPSGPAQTDGRRSPQNLSFD
jgi:hypothetical protein